MMKYELIEITGDIIRVICKYRALAIACDHAIKRNAALGEIRFAVRRIASNTIVRVGMVQ